MEFIAIIIIIALVAYIVINKKNATKPASAPAAPAEPTQEENIKVTENLPYKKKLLLTKNEWSFYKSLKPVADELGYSVLAKIRVADLVEVIPTKDRSEWQKYFNKINKKHVDFVLAKPENLQVILLIELDDNSHNDKQKQRDEFIEALYKQTGYTLLRTSGTGDLKEKIKGALDLNKVCAE
ncbi:MAG: DUF2726 domain-containing protein [Clostridia bacterium]|nr:DUF2726 domain-containing protein [Clostridia bacterium]